MSAALKAIHVGKRQLDLDDDDYRALLSRVTGKRSAKDMSDREQRDVLAEMRRLGFGEKTAEPRTGAMTGPFVAKLRALWLSAYHLGVVRNRTDKALIAFVERQTGLSHPNWLRDPRDAAKAIEGLKVMIARDGGVVWPANPAAVFSKIAVLAAQHRILGREFEARRYPHVAELDDHIAALGEEIRRAA